MIIKKCGICKKPLIGLHPHAKYHPERCRMAATLLKTKKYRERPENKKRANKRARSNYKTRALNQTKLNNRELFKKTLHLSKDIYTESQFMKMDAMKIAKLDFTKIRIV